MSKRRWEIRRVSTPERIFDKIKTEMAQPVGIVLFGANCDFKNEIQEEAISKLQGFGCYYNQPPDLTQLTYNFENFGAVLVILNSEGSASHETRHKLVQRMQTAGAKSLVGIYVKPIRRRVFHAMPTGGIVMPSFKNLEFNRDIDDIEQSSPTADGLDYLIIIEEE